MEELCASGRTWEAGCDCEGRPLPVVMIEKAIEAGVGDGLKWVAWATEVISLITSQANPQDVRLM